MDTDELVGWFRGGSSYSKKSKMKATTKIDN
jgi:hypothetical protein